MPTNSKSRSNQSELCLSAAPETADLNMRPSDAASCSADELSKDPIRVKRDVVDATKGTTLEVVPSAEHQVSTIREEAPCVHSEASSTPNASTISTGAPATAPDADQKKLCDTNGRIPGHAGSVKAGSDPSEPPSIVPPAAHHSTHKPTKHERHKACLKEKGLVTYPFAMQTYIHARLAAEARRRNVAIAVLMREILEKLYPGEPKKIRNKKTTIKPDRTGPKEATNEAAT